MFNPQKYSAISPNARALRQNIFFLLGNCGSITKVTQIHAQIVTNGYYSTKNFLLVKIIYLYSIYGHLHYAHQVFEKIERPNTSLWNQLIRGHAQSETPHEAVKSYNRMQKEGYEADGYTYSYTLSACVRSRLFREGEQIHGRVIVNGYDSDVFVKTNLVNMYSLDQRGDDSIKNAHKSFEEMHERTVVTWNSLLAGYVRRGDVDRALRIFDGMLERNVVSWTTMISGCARNGRCKLALSLFNQMQRAGFELDQVALTAALSACAELGVLNTGRWIHSYVDEVFVRRREVLAVPLLNALIHMYASCGMHDEAYEVFVKIRRKTTVSWTSMITGYARNGFADEALSVFRMMQDSSVDDVRPDAITFIGVLCACSRAGYIDQAQHHFEQMKVRWGIEPGIEHYGCMVDLLSRAGFLDEAVNLVSSMPTEPNEVIWGSLLGGCRIHKNVELAFHAAKNLILELDPGRSMGYLSVLSNAYAMNERWEDAAIVRQKMNGLDLKKPLGGTWVHISEGMHDFWQVIVLLNMILLSMRCLAAMQNKRPVKEGGNLCNNTLEIESRFFPRTQCSSSVAQKFHAMDIIMLRQHCSDESCCKSCIAEG